MTYAMKPLRCDPRKLNGLSEKLIVSHYENNYGGAVKRLNSITAKLAGLDYGSAPGFVVNGLKREELIATNSMDVSRPDHRARGEIAVGHGFLGGGRNQKSQARCGGSRDG